MSESDDYYYDPPMDEEPAVSAELLIKQIREEFYAAIGRKTGWGKEELKLEFERAVANALARCVVLGPET